MVDKSLSPRTIDKESSPLPDFYESALGRQVRRALRRAIRQVWPDVRGLRLLGLGHASPLLKPFLLEARQVLALDTRRRAPFPWPRADRPRSALADPLALPLPDSSIDLLLMVHELEHAADAAPLLAEARRVLTASGNMLLLVPHRLSLWAHAEHTPFGEGRPFTRGQLTRLLARHDFISTETASALWFPPLSGRFWLHLAPMVESAGQRWGKNWGQGIGGALLCAARPRMLAAIPPGHAAARHPEIRRPPVANRPLAEPG